MLSDPSLSSGKPHRRLSASETYELWVSVLTGQVTQREAAAKCGADRATVVQVCRTAKQGALDALAVSAPGRADVSAEQAALSAASSRDRVAAGHGDRAGGGGARPAGGKACWN